MGDCGLPRFLLFLALIYSIVGASRPKEVQQVKVACYSNPTILGRPYYITNVTMKTNTSIIVQVENKTTRDPFERVICAPIHPKLIPCPFDVRVTDAEITWQFCPEGESAKYCEEIPPRSFYTFLLISGLRDGDQGDYVCTAKTPSKTYYERWEVRQVYSNWDLTWTPYGLHAPYGFHVQLSHTGELQNFVEAFVRF